MSMEATVMGSISNIIKHRQLLHAPSQFELTPTNSEISNLLLRIFRIVDPEGYGPMWSGKSILELEI
ncbi:hypothetical protein VNO80_14629 [Phaseolus coccineus]|uniref:Uncharacterized protein n=1 Tax=Phaseolus coccineus TaxID=3886 RepID=A0AAN9MM58_PHACN